MVLSDVVSKFGEAAKAKLSNPAAQGEPEDQLRAPLEELLADLAELSGLKRADVVAVGESSLADLKTRPDYAVTVRGAQVGFIEVKAPGKGADPRRFKGHDKAQWDKLRSLPNLLYTDGNEFGLYRSGEPAGEIVRLECDIETAGRALRAPDRLRALFDDFLSWQPIPPRSVKDLAEVSARLCRFLRDEVLEQLENGSAALLNLRTGWQKMLFPEATDAQFADGYAQAVTFGLLVARARGISLDEGVDAAAKALGTDSSLIGAALRVLVQEVESDKTLTVSIKTMTRVLGVVDWPKVSKKQPDAWLYFYEDFLGVYDNDLRKRTGSYYTPPQVVQSMVRLVDEALRSPERFDKARGFADRDVNVIDPAVGTGTFPLGVLRRIAETVEGRMGVGAVGPEIDAAMARLYGFEIQIGPFAVAQLRVFAELVELAGQAPESALRMFVTDTLDNPYVEVETLTNVAEPIAQSRREANEVKRDVPITVVVGNPPYKEKAKGRGGWVEKGEQGTAILDDWIPPAEWGVSAHVKNLRNLYVYFWRWAVWKAFDQDPEAGTGMVCFITVAGFLNGPGFQRMRDDLRRKCDEIWVINCSPEGHQPEVGTRVFQDVQQPVCIVLALRSREGSGTPATVRYRALPHGNRADKFRALAEIGLDDDSWAHAATAGRASFLPAAEGAWSEFPALADLFRYDGSGVMPGRTWIIASDADSLRQRWDRLVAAPASEKKDLFHPHEVKKGLGDRYVGKVLKEGLTGQEFRAMSVAKDTGKAVKPVRYGFRSFDRQWIIPDNRLINRPNPTLWDWHSKAQVYLTAPSDQSPSSGPALTVTELVPDMHHYNGRGGRVFPLWHDATGSGDPNVRPALLAFLSESYGEAVTAEDVFAYVAAVASHPAYTARFRDDLVQPGLRIPITADAARFREAAAVGRRAVWLQTFGERFADQAAGRPKGAPRLPKETAPTIPAGGAISDVDLPEKMDYDEPGRRLLIGKGYVANVAKAVAEYEVSGKNVLTQWFSYRRKDRSKPKMGDKRPPSKLNDTVPPRWPAEYTENLIDLLNVLGLLVELEPTQAALLDAVLAGPLVSLAELEAANALESASGPKRAVAGQGALELS